MSRPESSHDSDGPPPNDGGDDGRGRQRLLLLALALVVGIVLVYAPGLFNDFSEWDDAANVLENPFLNPVTGASFVRFWTAPLVELYTPLTFTMWALLALAARSDEPLPRPSGGTTMLDPAVFHAAALALHVACALLVFALLRRVLAPLLPGADEGRRDLAAGAGAALWALHPVQVESVAWVTGMNNLLSGLFALLALHAYLSAAERGGLGRAALATLLFACALLSKPSVAALPLVALLLDAAVVRRPLRRAAPLLLVWCALSLGAALVSRASAKDSVVPDLPVWGRPFIVGDALAFYLGRIFATPWRLAFDYGRLPAQVLGNWWGYATWLVPAGIALLAWRLRWRGVLLGLGVLFAAALPMLGVVPFYFHGYSTVADRYLYLALLGPSIAVAWAVGKGLQSFRWYLPTSILAGGALVLVPWLSARQVGYWADAVTFGERTLEVNPRSAVSLNNIAAARVRQGRPDEAVAALRRAVEMEPDKPLLLFNLGNVLVQRGDTAEGIDLLERALAREPGFVEARKTLEEARRLERETAETGKTGDAARAEAANRWGVSLARQGRTAAALAALDRAVSLDPAFVDARYNRALTRDRAGDAEGALEDYRETLRIDPKKADAHLNVASLLARLGRWGEAEAAARAALAQRPGWPQARQALDLIQQQQQQGGAGAGGGG